MVDRPTTRPLQSWARAIVSLALVAVCLVPLSTKGDTTATKPDPSASAGLATSPPAAEWRGDLALRQDVEAAVTVAVGRGGGVVETAGLRLDVPAGALSDEVEITMTPVLEISGSPVDPTYVGGAHFAPEGLTFLRPATFTVLVSNSLDPREAVAFLAAGTGVGAHLVPRTARRGSVEIELWHFSAAGVSSGGPAAVQAFQIPPTSAEIGALAAIGAAEATCSAEQGAGSTNGPACVAVADATELALATWFSTSVRPGLVAAISAPYFEAEAAFRDWLQWQIWVAEKGVDDLAPQAAEARSLAVAVLADQVRRRLNNCTGTDLLSQLRDVRRLADMAIAGAIDEAPAPDLPPATSEIVAACAHVTVDQLALPNPAARGATNTLRGRASLDVWSGPNRTDVPLDLTFQIAGGGIDDAPSSPGPDGRFATLVRADGGASSVRVDVVARSDLELLVQHGIDEGSAFVISQVNARLTLAPGDTSVGPGEVVEVSAKLIGDDIAGRTISFGLSGAGTISATTAVTNAQGVARVRYMAPATGTAPARLTATLSEPAGALTSSMRITIQTELAVTIDPELATVDAGAEVQFAATVTGAQDTTVTWAASCGEINDGLFVAPSSAGECIVTATSNEDGSTSASAVVTVVAETPMELHYTGFVSAQDWNTDEEDREELTLQPWPSGRSSVRLEERGGSTGQTGTEGAGAYSVTATASQDVTPVFVDGALRTLDVHADARMDTFVSGCGEFDSECRASGHARSDVEIQFRVTAASTVTLSGTLAGSEGNESANDRRCQVELFGGDADGIDYEVACSEDGNGSWNVSFSGLLIPGWYHLNVHVYTTSNSYSYLTTGFAHAEATVRLELEPQ